MGVRFGVVLLVTALLAGCASEPVPAATIGGAGSSHVPADLTRLDDPLFDLQWNLALVRLPSAWSYATGRDVTIAILDSGIDLEHPDLREKLVLLDGAVFVGDSMQDTMGHGTGVAGIAAASTGNGIGMAGAAPDARIMPIRLFTTGGGDELLRDGFYDQVAEAIRFAADNGAHVISMSFGIGFGGGHSQVDEAIDHAWSKGVVLVAVAGNQFGVPRCGDPAAHPRVLCVASVGPSGERATYSNMDVFTDFVSAPGGDLERGCRAMVITTQPASTSDLCPREIDGASYAYNAGTSYAVPIVSGLAALLIEQGLTNEQVVERIESTTRAPEVWVPALVPPVGSVMYGHGIVDALCAVTDGEAPDCRAE